MTRVAVAVEGWNAEAAIGFALAARKFASSVTLSCSRETVDGKDEIEVVTLGPEPGEEVLMTVDGKDEKDAFKALLAELLGVIEPTKSRLRDAIGPEPDRPATTESRRVVSPFRGRVVEVAALGALDVEEVAPVRAYSKRMRRRDKKDVHRKQKPKTGRKPTTTRRKPRKHRK